MNQEHHAVQFLVTGIVQGVGYRMWTVRTAKRLGLNGWVRNLFDGRVEIHAEGDLAAIDDLQRACASGPRSAEVKDIKRNAKSDENLHHFEQIASASSPSC